MNKRCGPALGYQALYGTILVSFLLSLYTEVPLFITNTIFIPSFATLLLLAPFLALMFRKSIYKYEAAFVFAVFSILLVSAVISPGFEFIGQKLLGLLQTVLSVISGVLLVKLIDRMDRRILARILFVLAAVLVAGAVLEVLGILRGASDAFRDFAYAKGGYEVYESETRDLSITGFPRATFFVSEPSLLAQGFMVFANSWLLLAPRKRNFSVAIFMTALLFFVNGSPTLFVSAIISTAVIFYSEKRIIRLLPLVLCFLVLSAILVSLSPEVLSSTVLRFGRLADFSFDSGAALANDSTGARLVLPFLTLIDVWRHSPIIGVGISGKEVAAGYSRFSMPAIMSYGANGVATMLIYLGVAGSLLFVSTFCGYLHRAGIKQVTLLIIILAGFVMGMGAFESPRFWGYIFLFIAVMKVRSRASFRASRPERKFAPIPVVAGSPDGSCV